MKRLVVCDYPCNYTFPSFGFGSSEKRLWHLAKTASELPGFEVVITGPLWKPEYVPRAKYFPKRLDGLTYEEFVSRYGKFDYLFAGHEYFDKDEYVIPFFRVADKLVSYQLHPYEYKKASFDGKRSFLFCYSQEMVERYKDQKPIQALLFHSGVDENPYFTEHPKEYLLWMGRFDYDKSPHYAILAAKKLGLRIKLLGKTVYQPDYEKAYFDVLNDPIVEREGVVFGQKKMEIISESKCALYTLGEAYSEAGAGVLGEYLSSGVPIAGMTWKGNDAVCAAVDSPHLGHVSLVKHGSLDQEIADALADSVKHCLRLDRRQVYSNGKAKYDPHRLVRQVFDYVDQAD